LSTCAEATAFRASFRRHAHACSIARALVLHPPLLLMDEPFAALDEITRFKLNDDLLTLHGELATTIVFVTHSVYESVYLSHRIAVMAARPGRIIEEIAISAPSREPRISARAPPTRTFARSLAGLARRDGRGFEVKPLPQSAPPRWLCGTAPPVLVFIAMLAAWEAYVRLRHVPAYILPSPSLVLETLVTDSGTLFRPCS